MRTHENRFTPGFTAASAAFLCGMVTHMFAMVNLLNNHDNMNNQPFGYGAGVSSGRWLLALLGEFSHKNDVNYNLPFYNAMVFLFLLSCTAWLIISVLRIKNHVSAALIGMFFVVFPSVASTLMYRFTVVFYGIAIFLSVLAVWLVEKGMLWFPLSVLCIACSLGIYQAYVPMTIAIFVLLLLCQTLEGKTSLTELIRRGLLFCIDLILGFLLYLVILKGMLRFASTSLSDYQGINEMGSISLQELPRLFWHAFSFVLKLPVQDYCGVAYYGWIRAAYAVLWGINSLLIGYILIRKVRRIELIAFAGLLCIFFPIAANFIVIMCPDAYIYTLMVYGLAMIECVPAVLLEHLEEVKEPVRRISEKVVYSVMAILVVCYIYQTHINYTAVFFANHQVENYVTSMVTQVRMTEDFDTDTEWAVLGEIDDPLLKCNWEKHVSIGGSAYTRTMLSSYTLTSWIRNYYGYSVPLADSDRVTELSRMEEVKAMPCWPNEGSIRIIDDTVVIKCQDLSG